MKSNANHHIRLIGGNFFVVLRKGDRESKIFAGKAIKQARQIRDDLMRELGLLTETRRERRVRLEQRQEPAEVRLPRHPFEYYATGCVTLLAAVYATQAAYDWAMDTLDAARAVDARRVSL